MTALHPNSKSDTILLLDADLADIYVDLGPERTSLVDQTTYIDEVPSARSAVGAPRNITVKLAMQSGWSGVLIELGRGKGNYSWRISLSGSVLSFAEEGLLRAAVDVPGLTGSNRTVLVNWSQRVEGSSVIDEIAVGNLTTGAWAFGKGSHAATTPVATDDLVIGQDNGGTSVYSGAIGAFYAVHIGRRCRTSIEAREDWDTQSTASAFDGYPRAPILTGPSDELTLSNEGQLTGPSLLWSAAATRQAGQRAVGPLVNVVIRAPATEAPTASPVRFYRATPDGNGWQWSIRYLWHGYIGLKVNVAQVRIHVRAYEFAAGVTISPVRFRSYSVADLPLNGAPSELTYYRGPITSITSPHAAPGEWLDLGVVRLARDSANLSYFALGFLIDSAPAEGTTFNTRWQLNAITVEPYAKDLSGGGLGGDFDLEAP